MTPFRYDGSNNQPELSGLNLFNYSRADSDVDSGVYYPVWYSVWYLRVAGFPGT